MKLQANIMNSNVAEMHCQDLRGFFNLKVAPLNSFFSPPQWLFEDRGFNGDRTFRISIFEKVYKHMNLSVLKSEFISRLWREGTL